MLHSNCDTAIVTEVKAMHEAWIKFEQRYGSDVHTLHAEINVLKGTVIHEIRDLKQALTILFEQKQNHKPALPPSSEIQKTCDFGILVRSEFFEVLNFIDGFCTGYSQAHMIVCWKGRRRLPEHLRERDIRICRPCLQQFARIRWPRPNAWARPSLRFFFGLRQQEPQAQ
jgi:hypothetical protein